jgi:MYXO-CTERM domain-containing protein
MRKPVILCSSLLATLGFASSVGAATMYVSPTGKATTGCDRAAPCDLASAVSAVKAGDTVILMDGVYKGTPLIVSASGTSSSWITFQADECATPIIEGQGVGPTEDNQDTGVGSPSGLTTGQYVRYVGLVSRGWNMGFGNHWVDTNNGESAPSNGNMEYKYCIGDGNGRTGFTHFSASGIHIQNCISAHNGSSTSHSWSSGITLYATSKGSGTALVEGTISFENMDAEKHTDGSGFIVDEEAHNTTFLNNIGFRNGGGCFRLTRSSGTKFINNTCYHDALDPQDDGPPNPGEVYFTTNGDTVTTTGVTFLNNVFVATGTGPGQVAVFNQPTSGWSNNTVATGSVSYFTSPEGTNPDFTLASGSALAGKGSSGSGVPSSDIGFDPKCITKATPTMVGSMARASWWQYSIDIEYIKKIGGVAKCFNPKTRSGTPDIGSYANGAVTTSSGTCTSSAGGMTSTGGTTGIGGSSAGGSNAGGSNAGGSSAGGSSAGGSNAGGSNAGGKAAGGSNAGGASTTVGGATSTGGATSSPAGGNGTTTSSSTGGNSATSNGGTMSSNSTGGNSSNTGGNSSSTSVNTGGSSTNNSGSSRGGTASATGGSSNLSSSSTIGGNPGSATSPVTTGAAPSPSGCGCRVAEQPSRSASVAGLALLGLALRRGRRRRQLR